MKKQSTRPLRLATEIQRAVAKIINQEIVDKKLAMVTIADVEVSNDLSHAKIYVTFLAINDQDPDSQTQLAILDGYTAHIRGFLAKELPNLRIVPTIKFFYDQSLEEGMRMDKLVDQAINGKK